MRRLGYVMAFSLLGLVLGFGNVAYADSGKDSEDSCASLLNSIVPDENDGSWSTTSVPRPQNLNSLQTAFFDGSSFYKNNENGMILNVISLFGKVALKTWTCSTDLPPKTTRMTAMLRADGTWYVREDGDFSDQMFPTFDTEGHLTALRIMTDTEVFQYRSGQ